MFRKLNVFSGKDNGFSWWWFGIKIGVITALILWWWLEQKNKEELQEIGSRESFDENRSIPLPQEDASFKATEVPETTEPIAPPPSKPDDLTKIEGIGPKINTVLQQAGILTFEELASSEPATLKMVITEAGIRIGQPDTWPEQAALAAKGDWTALKELQSSLLGGRRVD